MNPSTARPERARSSISRRTVVVGTAWAVPAVVVASAAPALAASAPVVTITGLCRASDLSLRLTLSIDNPLGSSGQLTLGAITIAGVTLGVPVLTGGPIKGNSTTVVTVTIPTLTVVTSANIAVGYSIKIGNSTFTGTVNANLNVAACVGA